MADRRSVTRQARRFSGAFRCPRHAPAGTGGKRRAGKSRNTIEFAFSDFKRGMGGPYQHCGEAHLHRYLGEFDSSHGVGNLGLGTQ
jgi:hypothetical protein